MIATTKTIINNLNSDYIFIFGLDAQVNEELDKAKNGKIAVHLLDYDDSVSIALGGIFQHTIIFNFEVLTQSNLGASQEQRQKWSEETEDVANKLIAAFRDATLGANKTITARKRVLRVTDKHDANYDGVILSITATYSDLSKVC